MTEIEALKIFKPFIDEKCMEYKNEMYFGYEENFEALQVAIQSLEKQIEMKKYCGEHSCIDCPYTNPSGDSNRCMNDFIIDWSDEE